MPPQLMSPRLPGVNILIPDATGPQYARWRRAIKSAFVAKDTWGYCDGTIPMPMPESGPNFFSPVVQSNPQPELLEHRRAWVKKDRDVKLDIFLSVADDIKLEVFEVGPPLPPSAMTAVEMLEALDERFQEFKFEDYHHVFCHFLNLHIDQYASLEDFNYEFAATLEDLLDHGYPVDNISACSAYFSKLRCTQNPWVAKKLKEWDTLSSPPLLAELMKECPPWMIIRPLAKKPASQTSAPESYSEDIMAPSSIKEEEQQAEEESSSDTEKSEGTSSSRNSTPAHSRNASAQSLKLETYASHSRKPSNQSQGTSVSHSRKPSTQSQETAAAHSREFSNSSQEITIGASMEDLTISAFPLPTQTLSKTPTGRTRRMSSKSDISKMNYPPPVNAPSKPLPALPDSVLSSKSSTRSNSPVSKSIKSLRSEASKSQASLKIPHPTRPQAPNSQDSVSIHPALRVNTPVSAPSTSSTEKLPTLECPTTPEAPRRPASSHAQSPPALAAAFMLTPDVYQRPSSSRGSPTPKSALSTPSSWPMNPLNRRSPSPNPRRDSNNSSILSLPLQGATIPEYQDTVIGCSGENKNLGLGIELERARDSATTLIGSQYQGSPPRSLMSRLSAELNDDDKRNRKRTWSLKGIRGRNIKEIV